MNRLVALGLLVFALGSADALAVTSGPVANPNQAYPPSCLSYPLTDLPFGPSVGGTITILATDPNGVLSTEQVGIIIWRVPCAGGKSALVGNIIRTNENYGRLDQVPLFPAFYLSQGATVHQLARVAGEPNTFTEELYLRRLPAGVAFLFENVPPGLPGSLIDFSQALTIEIAQASPLPNAIANISVYDPSQYATASQPLPITGYLAGNFFDTAHGGEGIQTEAGGDTGTGRYFTVAWYTFDSTGRPFWLFGQGGYTAGDRSITLDIYYGANGGFAGNFGPGATFTKWGSMTVTFPDCDTLHFVYQAAAGLPADVPHGSGTKTWTRLTALNGLTCK